MFIFVCSLGLWMCAHIVVVPQYVHTFTITGQSIWLNYERKSNEGPLGSWESWLYIAELEPNDLAPSKELEFPSLPGMPKKRSRAGSSTKAVVILELSMSPPVLWQMFGVSGPSGLVSVFLLLFRWWFAQACTRTISSSSFMICTPPSQFNGSFFFKW